MIRRGGPADVPFLRDMLRHAYYWRWGTPEGEDVPGSRYVDGWGRPGDASVIALDEGFPVGAAWYRVFRRRAPGWGFVDEATPELSIAVVPSRRGRGVGEELLAALMERARLEGYESLSLSVEPTNPALKLYERFGFAKVNETGTTWTMKAELRSRQTPTQGES
ncbi:MAG: GNAT family N-acetyltransferase [Gaiellaceae bacterium]